MWNEENYEDILGGLITIIENHIVDIYRSHNLVLSVSKDNIIDRVAFCVTSVTSFITLTNICQRSDISSIDNGEFAIASITDRQRRTCVLMENKLKKITVLLKNTKSDWTKKAEELQEIITELRKEDQKNYQNAFLTRWDNIKTPLGEALKKLQEDVSKLLTGSIKKLTSEAPPYTDFFAVKELEKYKKVDPLFKTQLNQEPSIETSKAELK